MKQDEARTLLLAYCQNMAEEYFWLKSALAFCQTTMVEEYLKSTALIIPDNDQNLKLDFVAFLAFEGGETGAKS